MSLPEATGPLPLIEDPDTGDRFLVYRGKDGIEVDLLLMGNTFSATQAQMALMFGVKVPAISKHLSRIFSEGELIEDSVVSLKEITAADGKSYPTKLYDLNALIAVGYRIEGKLGTMFRIWATDKLFQYLTKGFVINVRRLENPDGKPDFFEELLEKIRHIRSSEKRMWTRILELSSFCTDYDPSDETQHRLFFAEIQNTMHWAVSAKTAAELVVERIHAAKENAGVVCFKGKKPTVAEASVAKNVMEEPEITALNHIASLILEFFESQAEQKRPTTLDEFLERMRKLVDLDGRPLKRKGYAGSVSGPQRDKWVSEQISAFNDRKRLEQERAGEQALSGIANQVKAARKPRSKRAAPNDSQKKSA
jgi:hypothetical protein